MRYLCLFFVAGFVAACRPYATVNSYRDPVSGIYMLADKASNRISSEKKLPRRIRQSDLFRFSNYTSDTAVMYKSVRNTDLFVNGCYDQKERCGYVLSATRADSGKGLSYNCILFEVGKRKLITATYFFNAIATNLQEAKPYLNSEHTRLFGGRIGTENELRKQHRQWKREAVRKKRRESRAHSKE